MIYALDSNTISYLLRKNAAVQKQFQDAADAGHEYLIPPMVYYEVKRWLIVKKATAQLSAFDALCRYTPHIVMDEPAWEKAIEIYVDLRQKGRIVDDADILIAAFCLVNDCVLATDNIRHFEAIDGLRYTRWQ